jgi:hypothetical protein
MSANQQTTTTQRATTYNTIINDGKNHRNNHHHCRVIIRRQSVRRCSVKVPSIFVIFMTMTTVLMMQLSTIKKGVVLGLSRPIGAPRKVQLLRNSVGSRRTTTTPTTIRPSSSSLFINLQTGGIGTSSTMHNKQMDVVEAGDVNRTISIDVVVSEHTWRKAAKDHMIQIRTLLQPGLTSKHHHLNSGSYRQQQQQHHRSTSDEDDDDWVTAMDPENPIYNFLIEYYGLKGSKGVRKLIRWAPSPALLLLSQHKSNSSTWKEHNHHHHHHPNQLHEQQQHQQQQRQHNTEGSITMIENMDELIAASELYIKKSTAIGDRPSSATSSLKNTRVGGILLEGATIDDFASTLHLRGAHILHPNEHSSGRSGVVYSPRLFFQTQLEQSENNGGTITSSSSGARGVDIDGTTTTSTNNKVRSAVSRMVSPFLWYQSILANTLQADPILHCYGLHEWAMQYRPVGAPPPPSGKYQKHLPLRVGQDVLNETVERKGVSCTHIDALRFFTNDALPLNKYGGDPTTRPLDRADQRRLEQPACVHAHMDLLKMVLKLQPFCDSNLLVRVLAVALEARKLDVSASPYDATHYGLGVIPIETMEGRMEYKLQQTHLMKLAEPIRKDLLGAYNLLLLDLLPLNGTTLEEGNRYLPTTTTNSRTTIPSTTFIPSS